MITQNYIIKKFETNQNIYLIKNPYFKCPTYMINNKYINSKIIIIVHEKWIMINTYIKTFLLVSNLINYKNLEIKDFDIGDTCIKIKDEYFYF